MTIGKLVAALVATAALLTGSALPASAVTRPDFRAQAHAELGLTSAQASALQQRVDAVLAAQPGGRQVSPTRVEYDGLIVTFDPRYSVTAGRNSTVGTAANPYLSCSYGWLCMTVRGTTFSYYQCKTWSVSNWWGTGPYINNQTPGTVARFYGQNGNQLWTSTAYASGTADWTPVWSLRPC